MAGDSPTLAAQLVHASPGRLRLRLPRAALENGLLGRAERALLALPGVQQVRANALASSLVVVYDQSVVAAPTVLGALTDVGFVLADPAPGPDAREGGSEMGRSIEDFFGGADERLVRLTRGATDLRTLVPLGLAALAAREVLRGRVGAAPWYTLAYWAFDSFVKLHREAPERRPPAQ